MYNYNNSYLHGFRGNIETSQVNNVTNNKTESNDQENKTVTQQQELQQVTPDFNVKVPVGYTKTGIEKLSNGQEIHCYKLNNGQKVMIAPKESAMTTLNTYVNTGSMNEKDDERGISHFCEHMAFNGTKGSDGYEKLGIGDVFRKVGDMGGRTNASTNFAETNYTISIPQFNKNDFETIVKMQSSMMNNLEMSDNMVDKEHGPVTSEINMYSDMPDNIAANVAIKNLYNIQTTSDDVVAGTVDNIMNVDSKKVMDYYKNNYYPANMTTVVTGDVNPDEAIEIIAKNFRGENPSKTDRRMEALKPIDKTIRKDIISNKAVATTGVICFNGPENNNTKDNIAIELVNEYLFNRLNSKINQSLDEYNADVYAGKEKISTVPSDGKLLRIGYDTTESNSEVALKAIFSKLTNFKAPNNEEMDTLKTGLKMKYETTFEDTDNLNYMLGQTSFTEGIKGCTDAINVIDSLTPQDLENAVHKYYDVNKASIAIIHPDKADINSIKENHQKAQAINFTGSQQVSNNSDTKINKKPLKTETIEKYTLKNNCEVALTNSKNDIGNIQMQIITDAPAKLKPGVAEVLSSMMRKNHGGLLDIADKNNISVGTGATGKGLYFEAEFPAKNLSKTLNLLDQGVINIDLNENNFEKAKRDVKNNFETAQPSAFDNIRSTLFPDSSRGYSNTDILNNVDNVTLEDVKGLFQYIKDNGSFSIAASLPTDKYPQSKTVFDNTLENMPTFKPNTPRIFNDFKPLDKSVVVTEAANTAQADVVQAYKFEHNHTPKELVSYEIMNSILSGGDETGLFNNLREKEKLAYSVHSSLNIAPLTSSTLACRILTTTDSPDMKSYDNVKKSITGFQNQINKMMNGEFTDKELETAKLNFKRYLLESTDNQDEKVQTMADGLISTNGIDDVNKQYELVDTITKEDIQNAAQKVFNNKPVYSIRASQDTLNANKDFLTSLENK